jgi:hypothetical protein
MGFSYDALTTSTCPLYAIRLEIGDTDSSGSLFDDSVLKASARAMEALAQRYARRASFSADGLSVQYQGAAQEARAQAKEMRKRAGGTGTQTIAMIRRDGYSSDVAAGS